MRIAYLQERQNLEKDWKIAQELNSIVGLKQFLSKNPDSIYTEKARQLLVRIQDSFEQKAWEMAKDKDSMESYKTFLEGFPEGRYSYEAYNNFLSKKGEVDARDTLSRNIQEQKAWRETIAKDTPEAYEIFSKNFPNGVFIKNAQRRHYALKEGLANNKRENEEFNPESTWENLGSKTSNSSKNWKESYRHFYAKSQYRLKAFPPFIVHILSFILSVSKKLGRTRVFIIRIPFTHTTFNIEYDIISLIVFIIAILLISMAIFDIDIQEVFEKKLNNNLIIICLFLTSKCFYCLNVFIFWSQIHIDFKVD